MHATCPIHRNIFGEKYEVWSYCLYCLLQPPSYIQIFPSAHSISTLSSHVVTLIWGTQFHSYTKEEKIMLCTESHTFLDGRWEDKRWSESQQYSPKLICFISTWGLLWFHQCLPHLLLNVNHLSEKPPPLNAELTPHQCLPHLMLNMHNLSVSPTYSWMYTTSVSPPNYCWTYANSMLPPLLLNVHHLSVSTQLLLNVNNISVSPTYC